MKVIYLNCFGWSMLHINFHACALIPYVLATILNPIYKVATTLRDKYSLHKSSLFINHFFILLTHIIILLSHHLAALPQCFFLTSLLATLLTFPIWVTLHLLNHALMSSINFYILCSFKNPPLQSKTHWSFTSPYLPITITNYMLVFFVTILLIPFSPRSDLNILYQY